MSEMVLLEGKTVHDSGASALIAKARGSADLFDLGDVGGNRYIHGYRTADLPDSPDKIGWLWPRFLGGGRLPTRPLFTRTFLSEQGAE